jgi:hypothetical protein
MAASVALAVGIGIAGSAVAAPTFFFPRTNFEDDLVDHFVDRNNNGIIDAGDSIITILEVNQTSRLPAGGPPAQDVTPPEHTGIMDADVVSATPAGTPGFFDYVFGPNPGGFLDADGVAGGALLTGIPGVAAAGAPTGTIVRAWDGPIENLDLIAVNCTDLNDCATRASDGSLFWSFGFAGATAEHFVINDALGNPNGVRMFDENEVLGSANFAMSILEENAGVDFGTQPCNTVYCLNNGLFGAPVQMLGSGTINGGQGLPADFFARGDFQFSVVPVPEPGTLALLGIALAGLGVRSARRKSASA